MILCSSLWQLEKDTGDTNLVREAIIVCQQAVDELPRERVPLLWATAQNELGNALLGRGEREGDIESIENAIAAYRYALAEFDQRRRVVQSANMHRQLGTAWLTLGDVLYQRGERDNQPEFLHRAVPAYRTALNEYTRGSAPLFRARTQVGLAHVLTALVQREDDTDRLKEVIAAYRDALSIPEYSEYFRQRNPSLLALTHSNLGAVLLALGKHEGSAQRVEEAIAAFAEAKAVLVDTHDRPSMEIINRAIKDAEATRATIRAQRTR